MVARGPEAGLAAGSVFLSGLGWGGSACWNWKAGWGESMFPPQTGGSFVWVEEALLFYPWQEGPAPSTPGKKALLLALLPSLQVLGRLNFASFAHGAQGALWKGPRGGPSLGTNGAEAMRLRAGNFVGWGGGRNSSPWPGRDFLFKAEAAMSHPPPVNAKHNPPLPGELTASRGQQQSLSQAQRLPAQPCKPIAGMFGTSTVDLAPIS